MNLGKNIVHEITENEEINSFGKQGKIFVVKRSEQFGTVRKNKCLKNGVALSLRGVYDKAAFQTPAFAGNEFQPVRLLITAVLAYTPAYAQKSRSFNASGKSLLVCCWFEKMFGVVWGVVWYDWCV